MKIVFPKSKVEKKVENLKEARLFIDSELRRMDEELKSVKQTTRQLKIYKKELIKARGELGLEEAEK